MINLLLNIQLLSKVFRNWGAYQLVYRQIEQWIKVMKIIFDIFYILKHLINHRWLDFYKFIELYAPLVKVCNKKSLRGNDHYFSQQTMRI